MAVLRSALEAGKTDPNGLNLAALREALVARGGESLKALLDQQLDQVIDTDLLIGVPQQRGADWVSALRNLGSIDVTVPVVATTGTVTSIDPRLRSAETQSAPRCCGTPINRSVSIT